MGRLSNKEFYIHYAYTDLHHRSGIRFGRESTWSRSEDALTSKIHVSDTLDNLRDFILINGQVSDIGQARNLMALIPEGAAALRDDKGYDSDILFIPINVLKVSFQHAAIETIRVFVVVSRNCQTCARKNQPGHVAAQGWLKESINNTERTNDYYFSINIHEY